MEKISQKRIYTEISISRGIGIISVVLFHSIATGIPIIQSLQKICDSFQMPLFFFLSGFVSIEILKVSNMSSYIYFIKKKAKRLIIPYFVLGILVFIPKLILNNYATVKIIPTRFLVDLIVFGKNPITFLWFLYVLFMIFIIYSYLIKKNINLTLLLNFVLYCFISIVNISIPIFCMSSVIYFANYFTLGLICRLKYDELVKKISSIKLLTLMVCSFIILFVCLELSSNIFIIRIIEGLSGIVATLSISNLIINTKVGKVMNTIGIYSYDIYLLSWFGQNIPRILLGQILGMNTVIIFVSMLIGGLIVGIISKYILRKIPLINKYILGN